MKETQVTAKDKVVLEKQAQQETSVVKIMTIVPKRGHTLFEINAKTKEVSPAEFDTSVVDFMGNKKRTVIIKEGYDYVSALNKKNALRIHQKKQR